MSHRRRRWPWVLGAVVGAVVGAIVIIGVLVIRGRPAGRPSVEKAQERFRSRSTTTGRESAARRPPAGVYTASGSGQEKLSFQTGSQSIGPTLPLTITWQGADCFEWRLDYNANHWQTWNYCRENGNLLDHGGTVFQRFDFVVVKPETTSQTTCDPPAVVVQAGMKPGDSWNQSCSGKSEGAGTNTGAGPNTYVGPERVDVGGVKVRTYRTRSKRKLSGSQTGTGTQDLWIATDTGMPVRSEWTLQVDSPSPIGSVTYTEAGTWTLDSLTPRAG